MNMALEEEVDNIKNLKNEQVHLKDVDDNYVNYWEIDIIEVGIEVNNIIEDL